MKPITRYTHLGVQLNSLLDQGKTLDYRETKEHIEDGSLFSWLKEQFASDIDLSLYTDEDKREMLDVFENLANAVDARRKFGVEYNGLALLVAHCFEGVQQLDGG